VHFNTKQDQHYANSTLGRLHWPVSEDGRVQLTREEFALLIGGIDLAQTQKRKWYRRPVGEEALTSPITL
jgi:hypothetical protein